MNSECRRFVYYPTLLCVLFAAVLSFGGCTNPEKAKAEHVSKGEAYLKDEKFQEASLEFRSAVQIDDTFAPAYWGLARAYEGLQRGPEMIEALRRAVILDGNNLDARTKLGNYYLAGAKGRPEYISEADRIAKEILQKDANHIEGHILMGSVLFSQNQKDKAYEELNHAIQLDPNRVESYLSLARFYVVTSDNAKAEELFRKSISINYNSAVAHTEYGKFLAQTNRAAEAEAELKKATEVSPTDRTAWFVLASYYYVNRRMDQAENAYKALADIDKGKPEGGVVLADFYSAINRYDDAIKIYQDALAKAPDFIQGRYRLGEILLVRGDTQGAAAQVDEVLKKDSKDRQALLLRARIRALGGQPDNLKAAVEDLNEVLKQEPNSRAGLYFMAQTKFNLGAIDEARANAAELERNYPDYLPAKLMQILISSSAGDAKTALRLASDLLERVNKTAPDRDNSPQLLAEIRGKAYLARGSAQLRLGNAPAARADFDAARQVMPGDPDVYNSLALVSINENKPEDAIAFFENALQIDNTNFNAFNGLINLHAQRKELDKAHARLQTALDANPNKPQLHYLKGLIFAFEQNAQGAEAEFRKAIELDSNYLTAYSALGALFINTRQEDRAIAEYKKIAELRPDNSVAYTLIGMLEYGRKNTDAAVENYRKALEKDQNAIVAANNLAWIYAIEGKGNIDEAVRLAQGVVQKSPNIAGFIDTLGWVYYKKGLYAAAVEQLQKAVTVDTTAARATNANPSPTYHFHLGMALKAKGDNQGARRELESAIKLGEKANFPDAEEARKTLAAL